MMICNPFKKTLIYLDVYHRILFSMSFAVLFRLPRRGRKFILSFIEIRVNSIFYFFELFSAIFRCPLLFCISNS